VVKRYNLLTEKQLIKIQQIDNIMTVVKVIVAAVVKTVQSVAETV